MRVARQPTRTMPHLLELLKPYFPYLWWLLAGLISLLVAHRSQIDHWAEQNPRLAGLMKLLRSVGLDPWMFVQALSLIVKGRLPKTVTAGSRSVRPPPLALVALMLGALALTGCPGPTTPAAAGAESAEVAKSVHASAVLVVRTLDGVTAAWLDSLKTPTPDELAAGRAITEALAKTRDVLNAGADVEAKIVEVAKNLKTVLALLESVGQRPPPEAQPVLEFIQAYAAARSGS